MLRYYQQLVTGAWDFARSPLPRDLLGLIAQQLERREARWLRLIRGAVFEQPGSPYSDLFRLAGCSFSDLEETVRRRGLESALTELASAGVYLVHDELKAKTPLVRSGVTISCGKDSFENPFLKRGIPARSTGRFRAGTESTVSTACRMHRASYQLLKIREFGLDRRFLIQLKPLLPGAAGLGQALVLPRLGVPVRRWYAVGGTSHDSLHYRVATDLLVAVSRLGGVGATFPVLLKSNDFHPVAKLVADRSRAGDSCVVASFASPAVRVVQASQERDLDISGTTFLVSGEALTPAKIQMITSAGCKAFSIYHVSEIGPLGYACRSMENENRVHLFHDSVAAITRLRRAPHADVDVESLLYTTLLPTSPKILINADLDDTGRIGSAHCSCVYRRVGFDRQISGVESIGKLTGHGMSLAGTEIVALLESVLPQRFGGAPGDFQLVELERMGETRIELRITPRLGIRSTEQVRRLFLKELRHCWAGRLGSRVLRDTDAVQVVFEEPFRTSGGKVHPLHLLSSQ
jgi:hypothetical protein